MEPGQLSGKILWLWTPPAELVNDVRQDCAEEYAVTEEPDAIGGIAIWERRHNFWSINPWNTRHVVRELVRHHQPVPAAHCRQDAAGIPTAAAAQIGHEMTDFSDITPLEPSATQRLLWDALSQVRAEYDRSLNRWLKVCVFEFCPAALEPLKDGNSPASSRILEEYYFHYRLRPDNVVEFCQGDTVLARARFEFSFTHKPSKEEAKAEKS